MKFCWATYCSILFEFPTRFSSDFVEITIKYMELQILISFSATQHVFDQDMTLSQYAPSKLYSQHTLRHRWFWRFNQSNYFCLKFRSKYVFELIFLLFFFMCQTFSKWIWLFHLNNIGIVLKFTVTYSAKIFKLHLNALLVTILNNFFDKWQIYT